MLFVVTGCTIDKMPAYLPDGVSFNNDSKLFDATHVPDMLVRGRYSGSCVIKSLFMMDSLDMTEEHQRRICDTIQSTDATQIVVTHGTDTMPETARYLASRLTARTVVLTGSLVPYSMGEASDALFNLGSAVGFAQALPFGVYVAMNGQAFAANNVCKDRKTGTFTTLR